jgi:putative ABC transport system substrate-binding protein
MEGQPNSKIPKVGLLTPAARAGAAHFVAAFRQGLQELGYVEGKTLNLEVRYGEGKAERISESARELVALRLDVIAVSTDLAISAVKRETQTIPIVMAYSIDPVGTGFVSSLAHPGGNITGLSNVSSGLSGKRLALLREAVPGLSRVAFLWNPDLRGAVFEYGEAEEAARSMHVELQSIELSDLGEFDRVLSTVTGRRAQALMTGSANPVTVSKRADVARFTLENRLPSMYVVRDYVDQGGLMSYGPSVPAMYRRAAYFVGKILRGAKAADLPVEQPTTFEMVINLRTAKALGLTIPPSLLLRADHVIQ